MTPGQASAVEGAEGDEPVVLAFGVLALQVEPVRLAGISGADAALAPQQEGEPDPQRNAVHGPQLGSVRSDGYSAIGFEIAYLEQGVHDGVLLRNEKLRA
jgi:hypothetical protein